MGRGGRPSFITVKLPLVVESDRSSSVVKELSGGRDGPVDRSGSTSSWNPMISAGAPTIERIAVHLWELVGLGD